MMGMGWLEQVIRQFAAKTGHRGFVPIADIPAAFLASVLLELLYGLSRGYFLAPRAIPKA